MKAGALRERITIQAAATGQDSYGAPAQGWVDVATSVPASVQDLNGREYLAAAAMQNAVQTKIMIRYLAAVVPAMRVLHGANTYNIEAVLDKDGHRREMLLMCRKGLTNG